MGTEIAPCLAGISLFPGSGQILFWRLGGISGGEAQFWLPGCWHHTVNGSNPCVRTLSRAVKSGDGKELESH